MKTKICVLVSILLLVTGCEVIQSQSIATILPSVLDEKITLSNQVFDGYKYYLPRGIQLEAKNDYNMTLKDSTGNTYYLYVDVISYYHQTKNQYQKNNDVYFSTALNYQKKNGYLEIRQIGENGYYFVEEMFNYAKLEAYVKEKDLQEAVIQMSTILNSISYNDKVLETLVGENILHYKEETFSILKPKGDEVTDYNNYLKVDQFIDTDNELPEEDQIEIKEEENK